MAAGLWIGLAAAAGAIATAIAGRKAAQMGQLFQDEEEEEEDIGVVEGSPGPAGGGGSSLGPVQGAPGPSGGGMGPSLGPVVAQGTPMPASPGGFSGGFPGTFPTMGPGSTTFGFGGGRHFRRRFFDYGFPFYYPPPPPPEPTYICRWAETPPEEDTPMICTPWVPPVTYPVTYGPRGWW